MGAKNGKVVPQEDPVVATITMKESTPHTVSPIASPVSSGKISARGPPLHLIPDKKESPTSVAHTHITSQNVDGPGEVNVYSIGDKVLGNFEGNGEWFPGVINKAYEDGVYDIAYDDGDFEESVPASDVKARSGSRHSSFKKRQIDSSNSPPLSAISNPPHKISRITSAQTSSTLTPNDDQQNMENSFTPTESIVKRTHSSSFKQLPVGAKKHGDVKPIAQPVTNSKAREEVDIYGEYDGSLDFIPRTTSQPDVRAIIHDEEDDEFAELDEKEHQKNLMESILPDEQSNSSAVIKNLYREDSKNNLLHPYEEKCTPINEARAVSSRSISGPTLVDIKESLSFKKITVIQSDKEYMEKREVNGGDVDGKISTFQDSQDHNHQEEVAEQPCQSDHYYNEVGNDNCGKFSGHEDKIHINKKQLAETFRSEQRNHGTISEPLQPAEEVGGNLSRDLKQVWEDDDLFGMKGMNIQRVDSVESLMDGDVAYQKEEQELGQGQDYAYHQDYYDQDESYGYNSQNNSELLLPGTGGQGFHSESYYSSSQASVGGYWGQTSEQGQDAVVRHEEHGGTDTTAQAGGGATDSGWSLCHTADGTPYFYSYELQESCWELPTSKNHSVPTPVQESQQELMFQPSQGFARPHTTATGRHVSQGVLQSKHELAKALNTNKTKSTLHLTNLIEDDDDAPYDLGLGSLGMGLVQPLKSVSSASCLKGEAGGRQQSAEGVAKRGSKGLKRPQSMAAMRRKRKDSDF